MAKQNYYGSFNPSAAAKALKMADRYFCQITDDGTIYAGSGYVLFKLTPADYAAIVQPVACCEAGNWTIDRNGKTESNIDAARIFADAVKTAQNAADLQSCPLVINCKGGKNPAAAYYNAEADFVALYNPAYLAAFPGAAIRTSSACSAAIMYNGGEAVGLVMPIRAEPKAARAVKAYFTEADDDGGNNADLSRAQDELAAVRGDLYRAANEIADLKEQIARQAAELEALHSAEAAPAADNKPEPKTAAEIIAARWAEVDGLTATIKGAQTAAPVVWLAGDTKPHAKAIEADGGKWSVKKNAYYFRVA